MYLETVIVIVSPRFALDAEMVSIASSQTAYNVTVVYNAYVPPAEYVALVAEELVAHPRNLYPVLVGLVLDSVT